MTATATAPARSRVEPTRAAPRPTPRSTPAAARPGRAARPLQVVEPPRRRYPARAVATVAVALVFGSMLASAIFHSVLVSGQARIDELGRQITVAEKGLAQDRLDVALLSSPERIAAEAERLGLEVADRQTWIRPGSGESPVVTGGSTDDEAGAADDADADHTGTGSDDADATTDGSAVDDERALGGAPEGVDR